MKKYNLLRLAGFLVLLLTTVATQAQDLHFSQYFNSPLLVNPANTGFSPDVDWRLGVNYRNQWASVTTNPYKTMDLWGDVQLFNNLMQNGWIGVGGSILRDVAGSGGLTSTKVYGSIAYHQLLGMNSLLSTGFSAGYVNQRVDFTKLTFDDQWNGKFFDVTIPPDEPFAYSSVGYFDLNAGVNYAYFPSDNAYLNAGVSVMHINRPSESFFASSITDERLSPRYTVFLNGSFKVNDQWIVNPNIYVSEMAGANETVIGLNTHYNLSGDGSNQLILGGYYRLGDAIIPMAGYQINDISITVSYDVTASSLSAADQTQGAYELSIIKTGVFNPNGKPLKCPTVRF